MDDSARCTAKSSRSGKRCKKAKAHGTDVCATHGAGAPQVKAAGQRRREEAAARAAVETYGLPVEIDPHDALLQEVHRTAGHVAWLGNIVRDLERDDLVWGTTELAERSGSEWGTAHIEKSGPNVWLDLYQRERAHLVKVAKTAIDAGIDERRVQLAEQQGQLIVQVIRATLADLGVEVTPDVAAKVGRHLRSVG